MKDKLYRYVILCFVLICFAGCTKSEVGEKVPTDNSIEEVMTQTGSLDSDAKGNLGEAAKEVTVEELLQEKGIAFTKLDYFYAEDMQIEILSDKEADIYYTLDGTDPNREKSLYENAITLKAGNQVKVTNIKAKAFYKDGTESETLVHSYFLGKSVESRFDTLVFSITTDPYNLYDYEYGIFVEGKLRDDYIKENPGAKIEPPAPANYNMRGREAEREVYVEVLEPDGTLAVQQAAGIRCYGGWSRAREQKSIKMFARKEYSETDNKFRYEFFPYKSSANGSGEALDSFKQLVLRNCGNDNGFGFIRDELFQTLAGQAGYQDFEAVRPAAMYVNGDYRGFFWLHEVYGDEYFEDHYGKYDGDFEILEGGERYKKVDEDEENLAAVEDYEEAYTYMDLTDDAAYEELCQLIDIENYLSYYAFQIYINNEDWPQNNYRVYRYYAGEDSGYGEAPFDGKWRYLLHDLDFSFGIYGMGPTTNNIYNYMGPNGEMRDAAPMFGQLMKRQDCREIFITKTLDLINGAFAPENLNRVLDEMHAERLNELKSTYNKGLLEDWVTYEQLEGRINDIKLYGRARRNYILTSFQDVFGLGEIYKLKVIPAQGCQVKINTFVTGEDFEGSYYTDFATKISAVLPEGKVLDYWLVNGERVEEEEIWITAEVLIDEQAEVSFRVK